MSPLRRALVRAPGKDLEEGIGNITVEDCGDDATDGCDLGAHDVEIRVMACCVNYPDLMQTSGTYQHKRSFPYTPGLEVAGVVMAVGSACSGFVVGDAVLAWSREGGMASTIRVPCESCLAVPRGLTFAQAAAFRTGYETAYHGLVERANVQRDEVVLVNGATGGMGFAAVQLAKALGCKVLATGGSDEKLHVVKQVAGADATFNYTTEPDFSKKVKRATGGRGVDVVFDSVGGSVFDNGLRSTAFGARVLIVGFTSGARPKIPSNYVLIKCLTVLGCRAGEMPAREPDGINTIIKPRLNHLSSLAKNGLLCPHISHRFPFSTQGVQQAFRTLLQRKVVGRVVVLVDEECETTIPHTSTSGL
mmetsp:Transcript_24033/g.44585  ORF Transcript_24033/g.44585 Transcript_24033/m.44585 type:complete len:362 (+) Transcript_24033:1-1086(+)